MFIVVMWEWAECEADWPPHLKAGQLMLPYFFTAVHLNYAHYSLCYLRLIERLPQNVLKCFVNGEHVMRHAPGV